MGQTRNNNNVVKRCVPRSSRSEWTDAASVDAKSQAHDGEDHGKGYSAASTARTKRNGAPSATGLLRRLVSTKNLLQRLVGGVLGGEEE